MIPGLKKRTFTLGDVMMYVAIGRKHLRLIVLLMTLSCAAVLTYYVFAPDVYYAADLIQLDKQTFVGDTERLSDEQRVRIVQNQLLNPFFVERAARKLGIKAGYTRLQAKYIFKNRIFAGPEGNLLLESWVSSHDLASSWGEALVSEYVAYMQAKRLKNKEAAMASLAADITEARTRLAEQLDERFEISEREGMTKALIEFKQLSDIPLELARLNRRIDEMARLKIALQDSSLNTVEKLSLIDSADRAAQLPVGTLVGTASANDTYKPIVQGQNGSNFESGSQADLANHTAGQESAVVVIPPLAAPAESQWQILERSQRELKSQIAELSRTYLPGHPKMASLQKGVDALDQKLQSELSASMQRFDILFQSLLDQKAALESKLPDYSLVRHRQEQLADETQFQQVVRLTWKALFDKIARSIETLDFNGEKTRMEVTYLGHKTVSPGPVAPKPLKLFAIALAGGILLSLGIPYLIEYLDHTMTNLEEAEFAFQVRGLGIVPKFEELPPESQSIGAEDSTQANLLQSFRVIRANLQAANDQSKIPQVIMVTSAMPREGKTVVSSNLAISFAQSGNKVLLIDTDLRRGRLHRLFGYRKTPGLSGVLLNQISLDEAIRPTARENLFVMTSGKHIEAGTELLGSAAFIDLIAHLRTRFDRIVFDTPPVLGLSETSIMQKTIDGVLFVIWSGHTPIRNIKAAIDSLHSSGANFCGFVLNQLDLSAPTSYYQYYYYSYDYYYSTQSIENV